MTDQPTPGEVLNGESVRLLLPGDVLRHERGISGTFSRLSETHIYMARPDLPLIGDRFSAFTFVSRLQPSGGQDGGGEAALMKAMLDALEPFFETVGPHADASYAAYQVALASPAKANGWPSREEIGHAIYDWLEARFPDGQMPGGVQMFADPGDATDAGMKHEAGCEELAGHILALFPRPEDEGAT